MTSTLAPAAVMMATQIWVTLLRHFADSGRGVLITTSDLAEALGLADTIIAFYRGRQAATFTRASRSEEDVLAAITGQRIERGAA